MNAHLNGHNNNTILTTFAERQPNIIGTVLRAGRQRAADTSAALSRRNAITASTELANTAITRLIELLYQREQLDTHTTHYANLNHNHRILIPIPWGDNYKRYALLATESAVLASHIKQLENHHPALLYYIAEDRAWYLNLIDYPTETSAHTYWQRAQLTPAHYRAILQHIRNNRRKPTT